MTGAPIKILGLSGSYGVSSSNGKLLKLALDYAQNQGIQVHNWDHEKLPLPLVGEEGVGNILTLNNFRIWQQKWMDIS